jgi:hypothetical protein
LGTPASTKATSASILKHGELSSLDMSLLMKPVFHIFQKLRIPLPQKIPLASSGAANPPRIPRPPGPLGPLAPCPTAPNHHSPPPAPGNPTPTTTGPAPPPHHLPPPHTPSTAQTGSPCPPSPGPMPSTSDLAPRTASSPPSPSSPPQLRLPPNSIPIEPPHNTHQMITRGKSGYFMPKQIFSLHTDSAAHISPIPATYRSALKDPN